MKRWIDEYVHWIPFLLILLSYFMKNAFWHQKKRVIRLERCWSILLVFVMMKRQSSPQLLSFFVGETFRFFIIFLFQNGNFLYWTSVSMFFICFKSVINIGYSHRRLFFILCSSFHRLLNVNASSCDLVFIAQWNVVHSKKRRRNI